MSIDGRLRTDDRVHGVIHPSVDTDA